MDELRSEFSTAQQSAATLVGARRTLFASQGAFFATLAMCVGITHGQSARVDGISFYGVYQRTVVLLIVGFAAAAAGLWRTAAVFADTNAPLALRRVLRLLPYGLAALLVTPFNRGTWLN